MHNPKSFLENEPHEILWDFAIKMNHLMSATRPDFVIVNEKQKKTKKQQKKNPKTKNCRIVDFTVPADHRVKLKES